MLAPEIAAKLSAFAMRRRRLLLLRGFCAAVAVWLLAMGVVAFFDRVMILEDWIRYALSGAAWGAAFFVLWRTCAKPMRHGMDPKRVALLIESARPELREELIAAVELGDEKGAAQWDSKEFRELVQIDVAQRMGSLEVDSLLPQALVAKWVRGAAVVVAVIVVLLCIPGLQFGLLLLRALAPMANLERVSDVKIAVVSPENGHGNVAANDLATVVVDVSETEPLDVFLDTFRGDGPNAKVKMQRVGRSRYTAEIPMRTDAVKYRVRAGDGATRKFKLVALPRPQVKSFAKTFHFPEYTGRAVTNVVEASGDLEALQGTTVRLVIEADQALGSGALNFDFEEKTNSVALEKISATKMAATVPMAKSGLYKVKLVGAETGFENKFSPTYEIRVLSDLLPTMTLDEPTRDMVVQPDERIALMGTASDDVGLARVDQFIQINNGAWRPVALETNFPGLNSRVTKSWDLFAMGLRQGDRVATKLVATDSRGHKGESTILRLLVGSTVGADAKDRKRVAVLRKVEKAMAQLRDQAKQAQKATDDAAKEMNEQKTTAKDAAAKLAAKAKDVAEAAEQAQEEIKDALRELPKGQDAQDLVNLGRIASKLQHENYEAAQKQLERAAQVENAEQQKQQVAAAAQKMREATWQAEHAERQQEQLLAEAVADVAASDLDQLAKEENRIKEQAQKTGADEEAREAVQQRQELASRQIEAVQDELRQLAEEAPHARGWQAKDIAGKLENTEREAARTMDRKPSEENLNKGLEKLAEGVETAKNEARNLANDLAREADNARAELARTARDAAEPVERAALAVNDARNDGKPQDNPEHQARAARADDAIKAAAESLRDRAELEELRREADAPFQRDLAQAASALDALRDRGTDNLNKDYSKNEVREVAKALRTLEAGHQVAELANDLRQDAADERWNKKADADALQEDAREFKQLANQERQNAQENLDRAGAPQAAKQALNDAFNSAEANQAKQEMEKRASEAQKGGDITKPLAKMAADAKKAREALSPAMAEARDEINQFAPSLAERMKALANNQQRMQDKTEELAQQQQAGQEETAQQLARQQDFNDKLDDLKNALRYDANAQDLGQQEGRERARDADDALAMLQKPPEEAEANLLDATTASQPQQRAGELNEAQQNQQQVANALGKLAEHYENLENGNAEQSRAELRGAESPELKAALDEQYANAAEIAALAEQSPAEAEAALLAELGRNPEMRQEFAELARENLQSAQQNLQRAVAAQKNVGEQVAQTVQNQAQNNQQAAQAPQQLQNAARQQENVQGATDQIGEQIAVAGREEAALGSQAGAELQQIGQRTEATAAREMQQAASQLGSQQQAAQAAPAVQSAQAAAQQRLDELNNAIAQMPAQSENQGQSSESDSAQSSAEWMARALDALMHGQSPQSALGQAQQQQSREMQMAREENRKMGMSQPNENSITLASAQQLTEMNGGLKTIKDWGNLPKQMAKDLMSAEQDGVGEEYRGQVKAYFEAVTSKAKSKK